MKYKVFVYITCLLFFISFGGFLFFSVQNFVRAQDSSSSSNSCPIIKEPPLAVTCSIPLLTPSNDGIYTLYSGQSGVVFEASASGGDGSKYNYGWTYIWTDESGVVKGSGKMNNASCKNSDSPSCTVSMKNISYGQGGHITMYAWVENSSDSNHVKPAKGSCEITFSSVPALNLTCTPVTVGSGVGVLRNPEFKFSAYGGGQSMGYQYSPVEIIEGGTNYNNVTDLFSPPGASASVLHAKTFTLPIPQPYLASASKEYFTNERYVSAMVGVSTVDQSTVITCPNLYVTCPGDGNCTVNETPPVPKVNASPVTPTGTGSAGSGAANPPPKGPNPISF